MPFLDGHIFMIQPGIKYSTDYSIKQLNAIQNSLFMFSLCLIHRIFQQILNYDAKICLCFRNYMSTLVYNI